MQERIICSYYRETPVQVEHWSCNWECMGSALSWALLCCYLGPVSYTHMPLSPSTASWYWHKGGDAVWLGR